MEHKQFDDRHSDINRLFATYTFGSNGVVTEHPNPDRTQPFRSEAEHFSVPVPDNLISSYRSAIRDRIDPDYFNYVKELHRKHLAKHLRRIKTMEASPSDRKRLIARGEIVDLLDCHPLSKGTREALDQEKLVHAFAVGHADLTRLNDPARLFVARAMSRQSFSPVAFKRSPLFERLLHDETAHSFLDFAAKPVEPVPGDGVIESITELTLQTFSTPLVDPKTGRVIVTNYFNGQSEVPAGSWKAAILAMAGSYDPGPKDAEWRDIQFRAERVRWARELIHDDPLFKDERFCKQVIDPNSGLTAGEFVRERALSLLAATVDAEPKLAVKETRELINAGARIIRCFDAGGTLRGEEACKALREEFGHDIIILGGQDLGPAQARRRDPWCDGHVVNITEGDKCKTAIVAGIAADNVKALYSIMSGRALRLADRDGNQVFEDLGPLLKPLSVEGGVGGMTSVAMLLGAMGYHKRNDFVAGTVVHPPFGFAYRKAGNGLYLPEQGEASDPTKRVAQIVDYLGRVFMEEGIASDLRVPETYGHPATWLFEINQGIAKTLRWIRASSILAAVHRPYPRVSFSSERASKMAAPHVDPENGTHK